jgi:hypothetical protein
MSRLNLCYLTSVFVRTIVWKWLLISTAGADNEVELCGNEAQFDQNSNWMKPKNDLDTFEHANKTCPELPSFWPFNRFTWSLNFEGEFKMMQRDGTNPTSVSMAYEPWHCDKSNDACMHAADRTSCKLIQKFCWVDCFRASVKRRWYASKNRWLE